MALAGLYRVTQDLEGNVVTGVLGTVTLSGTSTLATMFADAAGTLPLPNPTTNNPQYGSFDLFLNAGTYDMQFVKAGYIFEPQRNITLRDPAAGVNQLIGTGAQINVSPPTGVGIVTLSLPQNIAPDSLVQFGHIGINRPAELLYDLVTQAHVLVGGTMGVGRGADPAYSVATQGDVLVGHYLGVLGPPTYPLDVFGQARIANMGLGRTPDPAYALATTGPSLFGGFVGINGVPAYYLDVFGSARISTNLGIGRVPDASYSLATQGSVLVGTTLGVAGTPSYPLDVFGAARASYLGLGRTPDPAYSLATQSAVLIGGFVGINGVPAYYLDVYGSGRMQSLSLSTTPLANIRLHIDVAKDIYYGIKFRHSVNDTGPAQPILFNNVADGSIGSISTTATTTAFNTSSDARLKHDVTTLTGELALLQALRPVRFKWNVDDSDGVGFLAQEVAAHVAGVITGELDAVDEEGRIVPQMIDYAKLVPWLVGAIQTLVQRLEVLEDAAGI